MLLAAGVRKSPLATTGKRCEDGRPAIEAHWGIPKFRTITDATNRCDPQAPNAGIFMYGHVAQQTTDLEQMVLSILRIETPGGLLEATKEDIADAFRLIVTADVDFGNRFFFPVGRWPRELGSCDKGAGGNCGRRPTWVSSRRTSSPRSPTK
jgi:hypothetical protein